MSYDCHSHANEVNTLLASDPTIWATYERVIEAREASCSGGGES